MKIFTIGFTRKSAEQFFARLRQPGLVRLVDARLNNVSQLAGFTRRNDLAYFARELCGIDYQHLTQLAPSPEILDAYRRDGGDWPAYEARFLRLMAERGIEHTLERSLMDGACLLCSEPTAERCHRRLVAEYLARHWPDVQIQHL